MVPFVEKFQLFYKYVMVLKIIVLVLSFYLQTTALPKAVVKSKSELSYKPFNSQDHIGTGPRHLSLVEGEPLAA